LTWAIAIHHFVLFNAQDRLGGLSLAILMDIGADSGSELGDPLL